MANVLGTLNLLQAIVDVGLELEKFDTGRHVRGVRERPRESVQRPPRLRRARRAHPPRALAASTRSRSTPPRRSRADFLTMNYYDAFGVPGVVTRMFNNYGPRQNPRYVTGTIITQALDARARSSSARSSRCATFASAPTACAAT